MSLYLIHILNPNISFVTGLFFVELFFLKWPRAAPLNIGSYKRKIFGSKRFYLTHFVVLPIINQFDRDPNQKSLILVPKPFK